MESKKITRATLKSFIKKNGDLYVNVKSSFDGMTDGVEPQNGGFQKAEPDAREWNYSNTLGINGVWITGRDYYSPYDDGNFVGIEVMNSCGRFVVAVKKGKCSFCGGRGVVMRDGISPRTTKKCSACGGTGCTTSVSR